MKIQYKQSWSGRGCSVPAAMAPHSTSRSLVFLLLGVVVTASKLQAERAGWLFEQQLESKIGTDSRIVGGAPTSTEDFPWQLYVRTYKNGGFYSCGGSIISEAWSMSAAHCFAGEKPDASEGHVITAETIYLYAGATNKNNVLNDPDVQENIFYEVDFPNHLFVHQDYKVGARFNNDIAIFKNKEPWQLNNKVEPIALATAEDFIVGKELTVSGWGKTCPDCSTSSILLYVDGLNLISQDECTAYWGSSRITDNMICHRTSNANTCGGDSGGPVITGRAGSNGPPYVQIGIVSWGSSECDANVPKVFADVAEYRDWIDEIMSSSGSNNCVDEDSRCSKWAAKGKCSRGKFFDICKSTCECGVGSNLACDDTKSKCAKWAAKGRCKEKKVYYKCRSSCACGAKK